MSDQPLRVNPEMVRLARESKELTQTDLARLLGVPQSKISKIEAALLEPSGSELERLARLLDRPIEFFTWTDPVYGFATYEMFHRRRQKVGVRTLTRNHAEMNIRQMQLERLLRSAEIESDGFQRIDPDEYDGDVEQVARAVRAAWQLPPGPVKNIAQLIEEAGGVIIPYDFGTRQIDASSQWLPHLPPVFFVNTQFPADRVRLSLAHELGHLIMHRTVEPNSEGEATLFAAEFLMPAKDIRHELRELTLPLLARLKSYWRVSMAALAVRAHGLDTISDRQYRRFMMRLQQLGYRKREPIEIEPEMPTVFQSLIELHMNELDYSGADLARFLGEPNMEVLYPRRWGNLTVVS